MSQSQESPLDADTDVSGIRLRREQDSPGLDDETIVGGGSTAPGTSAAPSCYPVVPGYTILRELGQGGMGVVYLARDTTLDRCAALKMFKVSDAEQTRILTAEAKLSGKLNHASIVPVFEVNPTCGTPYFAMAFVDGEDLARRIARQVYSPEDAARLGVQIADAISHAHEAGVLHLDLKPANILLDQSGNPKVTDFGLYAFVCDSQTETCGIVGTPQFMSPEQALEDHENLGPPSDVYSIGAVLYAAITGRPPFVGSTPMELVSKVASQRPRHLQALVARVPTALDAIVMKCLEKSPDKRYSSASELRADLEAYLNGKPIQAKPSGLISKVRYQFEHHVLAASVSGTLALLLVLAAVISIALQAVKNHYDVARLQGEVDAIEHLYSRMHASYLSAVDDKSRLREIDTNAIQHSTDIAVMLAETNQPERAAMFAADAILIGQAHDQEWDTRLEKIVRAYNPQWKDSGLSILEMAEVIEHETHYTNDNAFDDQEKRLQEPVQ